MARQSLTRPRHDVFRHDPRIDATEVPADERFRNVGVKSIEQLSHSCRRFRVGPIIANSITIAKMALQSLVRSRAMVMTLPMFRTVKHEAFHGHGSKHTRQSFSSKNSGDCIKAIQSFAQGKGRSGLPSGWRTRHRREPKARLRADSLSNALQKAVPACARARW